MHILSLSDIQLIVDLYETQQPMADARGREQQVDNLIRTGYLRPLRGAYLLTELGEKTARSLQVKQFVPPRAQAAAPSLPPAADEGGPAEALENS